MNDFPVRPLLGTQDSGIARGGGGGGGGQMLRVAIPYVCSAIDHRR